MSLANGASSKCIWREMADGPETEAKHNWQQQLATQARVSALPLPAGAERAKPL